MSCLYSLKSQHTPRSTLFPYTTLFRSFLRALNLRGVPWTFSGNAGLYGRPEVRLLLAFLRAVAHPDDSRSEEHTSELQSRPHLVCRLLLEKKNSYIKH